MGSGAVVCLAHILSGWSDLPDDERVSDPALFFDHTHTSLTSFQAPLYLRPLGVCCFKAQRVHFETPRRRGRAVCDPVASRAERIGISQG